MARPPDKSALLKISMCGSQKNRLNNGYFEDQKLMFKLMDKKIHVITILS